MVYISFCAARKMWINAPIHLHFVPYSTKVRLSCSGTRFNRLITVVRMSTIWRETGLAHIIIKKKVVIYINPHKYAVERHYNYAKPMGGNVGRRIKPCKPIRILRIEYHHKGILDMGPKNFYIDSLTL